MWSLIIVSMSISSPDGDMVHFRKIAKNDFLRCFIDSYIAPKGINITHVNRTIDPIPIAQPGYEYLTECPWKKKTKKNV